MMYRCAVCRRTGWFSDASVAEHVDRAHRHLTGSCAKVRYRTSDDALDALIATNRRPREKRRETRRYQCGRCGGWHLTSVRTASAA